MFILVQFASDNNLVRLKYIFVYKLSGTRRIFVIGRSTINDYRDNVTELIVIKLNTNSVNTTAIISLTYITGT